MNLKHKLLLPFISIIAASYIIIHFIWLPRHLLQIKNEKISNEQAYLDLLGKASSQYVLTGDFANLHGIISEVKNNSKFWKSITCMNVNGIKLYPLTGNTSEIPELNNYHTLESTTKIENVKILKYVIQIDVNALIESDISDIHTLEKWLLGVLSLLSLAGVSYQFLAIKKPLNCLIESASLIKSGNYRKITNIFKGDLGGLIDSFNEMSREINAREKSLKQYQMAIEQSHHAIFITTSSGHIEYTNPSFSKITGYSATEACGQNPNFLIHEKESSNNGAFQWDNLTTEKSWQGVIINRRKNNELYHADQSISPIKNKQEEVIGFVAIQQDITDKVNLENQLIQEKRKADEANKLKSEFIANMSHEIRTPLNAIIGFGDILCGNLKDQENLQCSESIKIAGSSLLKLINDILDLSKIDAGMMTQQKQSFSIHGLFSEIKSLFQKQCSSKDLKFSTDLTDRVPKMLIADDLRLRQCLVNLAGNAIKFTHSGQIKIHADFLQKKADRGDLTISVSDSGIGIPEDQQSIIFDSFRQKDGQSTRDYGGTGLGLSLTLKFVQMMGGELTVSSKEGLGSTFTILIKDLEISQEEIKTDDDDLITFSEHCYENCKVLIVDDVLLNRTLLKKICTSMGAHVIEAENGEEAVIVATEILPDLILMDIRMPVMDGYEATKRLKATPKTSHIPIAAITASVAIHQKKFLDLGFASVIKKPFKQKELLDIFSAHLTKSEPKQQPISEEEVVDSNIISGDSLSILNNEFKDRHHAVATSGQFNEIEEFANQLVDLSQKEDSSALSDYSQSLLTAVENFDIDLMKSILKKYDEMVSSLHT